MGRSRAGGARNRALGAAIGVLAIGMTCVAGCASPRPVIYPDNRAAEQDIADCMQLARAGGADAGAGADVARTTATGAAVGAAATGVYGAVRGYDDVGARAGAGAAAGGAAGLIRGVVKASEPGDTYKRYVNRCLAERGHDVLGWN
jgi:hypothetical protein